MNIHTINLSATNKFFTLFLILRLNLGLKSYAGVSEQADDSDLKSDEIYLVRVRSPSPAPRPVWPALFSVCVVLFMLAPLSDMPKTLGKSCRTAHAVLDDDERCATKKN